MCANDYEFCINVCVDVYFLGFFGHSVIFFYFLEYDFIFLLKKAVFSWAPLSSQNNGNFVGQRLMKMC